MLFKFKSGLFRLKPDIRLQPFASPHTQPDQSWRALGLKIPNHA